MFRFCAVLSLLLAVNASGQLDQSAPPELDESLRESVSRFYTFFQQGRFREAEDLVDHESKDLYYDARKERIISFELRQVNWAEDFREADVLVAASWVLPTLGNAPVPIPLTSNWRLVDGVWRLHLKQRPETEDGRYVSPAGPMVFSDKKAAPLGSPAASANTLRPTLESLKGMYEVSEDEISFARRGEGVQTREITVTNKAQGSLTVELVGQTTGIEVTVEPEKTSPGDQSKIVLTFDPAVGSPTDSQTLQFLVMPIRQPFELLVNFR